jgi:hypothetical protein
MSFHLSSPNRRMLSTAKRSLGAVLCVTVIVALLAPVIALAKNPRTTTAVSEPAPGKTRSLTPEEEENFRAFIAYWAAQDICWKSTTTRGVGTIPTECPGKDKDAGLCYPKCPAGMYGLGPVCWQNCPAGWTNTGAHCTKPASYGRGGGYPWQFGDPLNDDGMIARCEKDNGKGNCEKDGVIYYPKCKAGFHKVGCCVCSPDCPAGMLDIGVSCQKQSQGRGVGQPMNCAANLSYDAGLCYPKCPNGSDGVGPVCWAKCSSDYPFNCGAACGKDQKTCALSVVEMVTSTGMVALNIASLILTAGAGSAAVKAGVLAKSAGTAVTKKMVAQTAVNTAKAYLQKKAVVVGITLTQDALNVGSRAMAQAKEDGDFDYSVLDPTGIAEVVKAFNKPPCGQTTSVLDSDIPDTPVRKTVSTSAANRKSK